MRRSRRRAASRSARRRAGDGLADRNSGRRLPAGAVPRLGSLPRLNCELPPERGPANEPCPEEEGLVERAHLLEVEPEGRRDGLDPDRTPRAPEEIEHLPLGLEETRLVEP